MSGLIALLNKSTLGSDADAATMAKCIDSQIWFHFAPAWDMTPWRIVFYPASQPTPAGACPLGIFDDADQAGALGYHDVDPHGWPYGKVFVRPILEAGGGILDGAVGGSVSATVSHEALEIPPDAWANVWVEMPDGREVARESCDPVESDGYILRRSDGPKCQVSNFVTENWFEHGAPLPFDFMRRLPHAFTMSAGGYLIVRQPGGQATNVWGDAYPAWRRAMKEHEASRTARRIRGAARPVSFPMLDPAVLAALPAPAEPLE